MLPNHSREDLEMIERFQREAEMRIPRSRFSDPARDRWHSAEIREMAVFSDTCRHCAASQRRERLAISAAVVALGFSALAVIAAILFL